MALAAQVMPDTSEIESTGEVLISADKTGERRQNISRQIEVIDAKKISFAQQTNLGDILQQSGQVYLQKSQFGGGSPVLRGFEASRVLLVMDGIRMNNAIYRAGHLQDIMSIDPYILDRVEVVFGSASTLYGSDALGGAIYMKTKTPQFSDTGARFNLSASSRYASAANGLTGNLQFSYGRKNLAWFLSGTINKMDDLRSGAVNFSNVPGFGDRPWYVERVNGVDSMIANPNPRIQKGTGYSQADLYTKLVLKTGTLTHTLGLQYSGASVIPRYDRLWPVSGGSPNYATWDYTPQNRAMLAYTLQNAERSKWKSKLNLAAQASTLGRRTRRFRNDTEKTQLDKVIMYTLNWDNSYRYTSRLKFMFGAEAVLNNVESSAENRSMSTGVVTRSNDTRYADGGGNTASFSVYAGANWDILPGDLVLNMGLRESFYSLKADFTSDNFLKLPYSSVELSNLATTFNLGLSKRISQDLFLKFNISSGFRNPNIDDMTKLFESKPGTLILVPNKELEPEQTITYDFGLNYNLANVLNIESGAFYTVINNLLTAGPSTFNGLDSLMYDGKNTRVYTMMNAASGYVQGLYIGGKVRVNRNLYFDGSIVNTFGRYKADDNTGELPLDHIPPTHGKVGIRWVDNKIQVELFSIFNGKKRAMDYSPSGEDNEDQSPNGETPGWITYNARIAWTIDKHWNLTAACENLGDLGYRQFASGVNAPGRNFIFSVNFKI